MNFPLHGFIGAIVTTYPIYLLFKLINFAYTDVVTAVLFTLFFIIGIIPDIIGAVGRWNYDSDKLYKDAHNFKGIFKYFKYLPPFALHILIDRPTHDEIGNWKWWAHIVEVVGWIFTILFMYWWLF